MSKTDIIDLHSHSTASDGSLTPTELMRLAKKEGLKAIALSDHDCIDGLEEAADEAERLGIELVCGLELSLTYNKKSLHMLGYLFDRKNKALQEELNAMLTRRNARNAKVLARLEELDITVTMAELEAEAGGGAIGRPHLARLLIAKGVVSDFNEAFDKYIGAGKPAYIAKERIAPEAGIDLIHKAGGLAVLAHPLYSGAKGFEEVALMVESLVKAGLDGIECHYSDHSEEQSAYYEKLARRHGLCITGGSDFHGAPKPDIPSPGRLPGGKTIPYSLLEGLKAAHRKRFGDHI